jgi:hypothetical protein
MTSVSPTTLALAILIAFSVNAAILADETLLIEDVGFAQAESDLAKPFSVRVTLDARIGRRNLPPAEPARSDSQGIASR